MRHRNWYITKRIIHKKVIRKEFAPFSTVQYLFTEMPSEVSILYSVAYLNETLKYSLCASNLWFCQFSDQYKIDKIKNLKHSFKVSLRLHVYLTCHKIKNGSLHRYMYLISEALYCGKWFKFFLNDWCWDIMGEIQTNRTFPNQELPLTFR